MINNRDFLKRTETLIGKEKVDKLINSKVAIFGLGGVGSYTFEALIRMGVGEFLLVDFDRIDQTNINRQLLASQSTIGRKKIDLARERGLDISPEAIIKTSDKKVGQDNIREYNLLNYDYVIDAIDDTKGKLSLIKYCKSNNIEIISAMGGGNKLDPTAFKVSDIYNTKMCPLAKVMRKKLRDEGIKDLKVVYSEEKCVDINRDLDFVGTVSYVPSTLGLIIAGEVIKDLIN